MEKKLERLLTQMEKELKDAAVLLGVIEVGKTLIMQYADILKDDADEQIPTWHTEHRLRELRAKIDIFDEGMGIEFPANSRSTRNFKKKVVTYMSDMLTAMEQKDEFKYIKAKKRFTENVPKYYNKAVNEFRKRKQLIYTIYEQAYGIDAKATEEKFTQIEDAIL